MDAFLLQQYNLRLAHLAEDILALEKPLKPDHATTVYELLHIHSHGFSFADATAHKAALRCIEWGAHHQPLGLSTILFRGIPAVLSTTSIADASRILYAEQKGFVAVHNGEDWVGLITYEAMNDAMRYDLGHFDAQHIMGSPPPLIDIEAPITLAKELLRRSVCPVLIVLEDGKSVGYVNDQALIERLRPQVLPKDWTTGFGSLLSVAHQLSEAARTSNCLLYLVGGGVRDLLLGEEINDLDCSIIGDSVRLALCLQTEFGGEISRDDAFGALHWTTVEGVCVDITVARTEHYPEREDLPVVLGSHLLHDMGRRDFSLNAMAIALHPHQWGQLIDAFGGYSDLKIRQLRTLHGLSFLHDPLRILRAARYASRFGLALDPSTEQNLIFALRLNAGKRITKERLGNEIHLIFADSNPVKAWALLSEWGCIAKWIPELSTIPTLNSDLRFVFEFAQRHHFDVSLALWLLVSISLTAGARERLSRLTATNKERHRVWTQSAARFISIQHQLNESADVAFPERYALWGEALYKTDSPLWSNLAQEHGDAVQWWNENGRHIQIAVDGEQLMTNGIPKGPQIGACLRRAWRQAWMGGDGQEQLAAALSEFREKT